ncbi:MAG TPA: prolyl oligopeptidase family serine peptidase [Candidatus Blautia merdipullorum]|nr:prolyl oligopeptidase family serine peptidase [Candidatus Blautia merdipullorum]
MGRIGEVNCILKGKTAAFFIAGLLLLLSGCQTSENVNREQDASEENNQQEDASAGQSEDTDAGEDTSQEDSGGDYVTEGTEEYRGFTLDNVLHSQTEGDIHYNLYIPDSYDGEEPCAIFFTLPGYEGLYFQGVGENLYSENFGFEAQNYDPDMIIVAPQLSDWGETSADQTIALVEYFLENYNIDPDRVYGEGYSGGGETMSQVMGKRPDLFTAYLQCSSQWDGDYEPVVENRTPVYFVIGESDEYYGCQPTQDAYDNLYELYRQEGLSDEEISQILVLDIKDADYFESQGVTVQHGGGNLFARDQEIMNWLFSKQK